MVENILQIGSLAGNCYALGVLNLVASRPSDCQTTDHADVIPVSVGPECIVAFVAQVNGDFCPALAGLDVVLCRISTARCSSFSAESKHDGCKNGTFAATVLTGDKVDLVDQVDFERAVAHEVVQLDSSDGSRGARFLSKSRRNGKVRSTFNSRQNDQKKTHQRPFHLLPALAFALYSSILSLRTTTVHFCPRFFLRIHFLLVRSRSTFLFRALPADSFLWSFINLRSQKKR